MISNSDDSTLPTLSGSASAGAVGASPRAPARRRAPARDGEALVAEVLRVLDGEDAEAAYGGVQALLAAGCERSLQADHLDRLVTKLRAWPECPRLAAELSIRTRLGLASSVARSLRSRLLEEFARDLDYPRSDSGQTGVPQAAADREAVLRAWVERIRQSSEAGARRRPDQADSDEKEMLSARGYAALVCLLGEARIPTDLIYGVLDVQAEPAKQPAVRDTGLRPETMDFLRQLQRDVLGVRGARKHAREGLNWAAPARDQAAKYARQHEDLQSHLQRQAEAYALQQQRYQERAAALEAAERRIADLEAALANVRDRVVRAEERLQEREDHWRITAKNQLEGMASRLREQLQHELDEALFALESSTPQIDMAVRRLQRARSVVRSLETPS